MDLSSSLASDLSSRLAQALEEQEKVSEKINELRNALQRLCDDAEEGIKCPSCKIGTLEPIAGSKGLTCMYCDKEFDDPVTPKPTTKNDTTVDD